MLPARAPHSPVAARWDYWCPRGPHVPSVPTTHTWIPGSFKHVLNRCVVVTSMLRYICRYIRCNIYGGDQFLCALYAGWYMQHGPRGLRATSTYLVVIFEIACHTLNALNSNPMYGIPLPITVGPSHAAWTDFSLRAFRVDHPDGCKCSGVNMASRLQQPPC